MESDLFDVHVPAGASEGHGLSESARKMKFRFPHAIWKHRELWWRLTEREVLGRYRGSALGIGWSFITPLAMLAVYTFVFSQVFKARLGGL